MPPTLTDAAPGPRIDPRFARRWVEVRREQGRRRLRVVVAVAALVAAGLLVWGCLYSPLFKVRHVRVSGVAARSAAGVAAVAGLDHYALMIDVNATAIEHRLDAVPSFGAARVQVRWPATVAIEVTLRQAVAVVVLPGGRWASVDETGRVLADGTGTPPALAVLSGVSSVPFPGGWLAGSAGPTAVPGASPASMVDMNAAADSVSVASGVRAALAAVAALPGAVRSEVRSVDAAGPLVMVVQPAGVPTGPVTVTFGDGSQLAAKVEALDALLGGTALAGVQSVDLTVPQRPAALTAR